MAEPPEIAAWLVAKRLRIEQVMTSRLGPAAPTPGSSETEALRRFRSYAVSSLRRGAAGQPSLDGIRVNERRASALVAAWCDAAAEVSGPHSDLIGNTLQPIYLGFRTALRTTSRGRRSRGTPRAGRRAIVAAIDRICDAFFAIDADSGRIVDANPAAAALLGVARDALIDVEATRFIPAESQSGWWTELDAVTEGTEPRRFRARLADVAGIAIPVDCTLTPLATRRHHFALVVARPT